MIDSEITYLDYFAGGLPAGVIFKMDYDNLLKLIDIKTNNEINGNTLYEISLIGLVSYIEAFFKNHFASLININNKLVVNLREKGREIDIDVNEIVQYGERINLRLGCIICEKFDFGTASKINSLFFDLIKITPFSKDEIKKYDNLQRDRNLLVHHGGIYTNKYMNQIGKDLVKSEHAYWHSIIVDKNDYISWAEFILPIIKKTCYSTQSSLKRLMEQDYQLAAEKKKAIDSLIWELELT